jgi:3-hydroxyacyl-[acyl-carrier-protein] dehydratase
MIEAREILKILPHRYPFVMVDRILEMEDDKYAIGIKNCTINEPFFQGHFPDLPTMPGVMIAEAMAQVGGIMLMASRKEKKLVPYLAGISNLRLKKPVYPGDTLRIRVDMIGGRGGIGKVKGEAKVDDKVVATAEMSFALVPPENVK